MKNKGILFLSLSLTCALSIACDIEGTNEIKGLPSATGNIIRQLSVSDDITCYEELIKFLTHDDQSVRLEAAYLVSKKQLMPQKELTALISNFSQPHGEEGLEYVSVVSEYKELAMPYVQEALNSQNWLVRDRACRTIQTIKSTKNKDVCK